MYMVAVVHFVSGKRLQVVSEYKNLRVQVTKYNLSNFRLILNHMSTEVYIKMYIHSMVISHIT